MGFDHASSDDFSGRFLPKKLVAADRLLQPFWKRRKELTSCMYGLAQVSCILSEPAHEGCMGEFGRRPAAQSAQAEGREVVGCRWVMGLFHTMLAADQVCFIQELCSSA